MTLRGFEPGKRVALLISECQRGVVDPSRAMFGTLAAQVEERQIIPRIARLANSFRRAKQPVVHLWVSHRPDYADTPRVSTIFGLAIKHKMMISGSTDVEPVPGLEPQQQDHIQERRFSLCAFNGTDLNTTLRNLRIDTLVLTGVSSNVAINSSSIAGSDLGYQIVIPEDCIAGATAESHDFMVHNLLPLYATLSTQAAVEAALTGLAA